MKYNMVAGNAHSFGGALEVVDDFSTMASEDKKWPGRAGRPTERVRERFRKKIVNKKKKKIKYTDRTTHSKSRSADCFRARWAGRAGA